MFPDLPFKTQWHILSTNFSAFADNHQSSSRSGSFPSIEIYSKSSQSFASAEAEHLIFTCQKSTLCCKVFLNWWSFQWDHSSGNHPASWAQNSQIWVVIPLMSWWSCVALDNKPNPTSQLSPSEPLCLWVWLCTLFHVMSKNKIQLDEILRIMDPILLANKAIPPFFNHSCLADAELSTLKNGQNHSKVWCRPWSEDYQAICRGVYTSSLNPKVSA